jgi:hypothetical protein
MLENELRIYLAQLNFTSKVVFLENRFTRVFFSGTKLFRTKVLGKVASPTAYEGESWDKLLFSASSQLIYL